MNHRRRLRRFRRRRAFTFIEAVGVMALLAILSAGAAVALRSAARAARVEDTAARVVAFDRATRDAARGVARTPALRFDLNRGTVRRTDGDREPSPLRLHGARVKRVICGGSDLTSGEVSVRFSTLGQSPSYAVLLSAKDGERWVAFAGLSGQPLVLHDGREVQDILAAAAAAPSPARADAR